MFFVMSSGRSGSMTIAQALNNYENCKCYHHKAPEFVVEATEYYYDNYAGEKIADILRNSRMEVSKKSKIYGEVNLQFSLIFPVIEKIFPGSKYIWLIRDGRDAVASMYYRRWFDPFDKKITDEWKKGRLRGDLTGDFSSSEWEGLSRFAKCCWLWKKYNRIIESHLNSIDSDRWMIVRLNNLKTSLPEISGFLGLDSLRKVRVEKLNKAYQPVSYWENWDNNQRTAFETFCADEMNEWFPDWKNESGEWIKILPEVPDNPGFLLQLKRVPKKLRVKLWEIKRSVLRRSGAINN